MSSELDQQAFSALRRLMNAAEDAGQPPQLVLLLILLTAMSFMLTMYFTTAYVR